MIETVFHTEYLTNTGILETSGRVFGLDAQFLADAVIMAIAMLVLFTLLSYLLYRNNASVSNTRMPILQGFLAFFIC